MGDLILCMDLDLHEFSIGLFDSNINKLIKTSKQINDYTGEDINKQVNLLIDNFLKFCGIDILAFDLLGIALHSSFEGKYKGLKKNIRNEFKYQGRINEFSRTSMEALGYKNIMKIGDENVLYYNIGKHVEGSIVINNNILECNKYKERNYGHMKVFKGLNTPCYCGSNGCLEQLVNEESIIRMAKAYFQYEASVLEDREITIKRVFESAMMFDSVSRKVLDRSIEALAISIKNVILSNSITKVIIAGEMASGGSYLLDRLIYFFDKHEPLNNDDLEFKIAVKNNKATLIGVSMFMVG